VLRMITVRFLTSAYLRAEEVQRGGNRNRFMPVVIATQIGVEAQETVKRGLIVDVPLQTRRVRCSVGAAAFRRYLR
jgi:hypothetical protein